MWRQWLQQAEGLVLLPDAEEEPADAWLDQQRRISHRACVVERRIHSNPAKRQHMFTVRHPCYSLSYKVPHESSCMKLPLGQDGLQALYGASIPTASSWLCRSTEQPHLCHHPPQHSEVLRKFTRGSNGTQGMQC